MTLEALVVQALVTLTFKKLHWVAIFGHGDINVVSQDSPFVYAC